MAIPSWEQFKEDTKKPPATGFGAFIKNSDWGRGPKIIAIDNALKKYDKKKNAKATEQIKLLQILVRTCLDWLQIKKGKPIVVQNITNDVFKNRKAAITNLANEALKALYQCLIDNNMVGRDNMGRIKFMINKTEQSLHEQGLRFDDGKRNLNIGQTHTFAPKDLRAMGNTYQYERQTYLDYKQQNTIHQNGRKNRPNLNPTGIHVSGSGVHAVHDSFGKALNGIEATNRIRVENKQTPFDPNQKMKDRYDGVSRAQITRGIQLAKVNVENLSVEDWQFLDEVGRIVGISGSVEYANREKRYQYMVIADHQGRLRNPDYALIDAPEGTAYAMDKYGNLFQHQGSKVSEGFKFFNHSSFNAGKDVICAGTIWIVQGNLKEVTNETGHYKTSREHLLHFLDVLRCEGVDLMATIVKIATYRGLENGRTEVTQRSYRALDLLANPQHAVFVKEEINLTS